MNIFTLQIETIKELLDWRVSLDIVLIALGIFFLYQTLRTIGTWKIVVGVIFAAGVFIGARFLDLRGIEWIFSNLSQVLVLALLIIFQPEIRKILERAASIRRRDDGDESSRLAFLISDVAFALAQQQRGAIFVMPGSDSVKARTSEGIPLNASPSFPLLMSIFDPHSPGHDGAVIIDKGVVVTFAVRLPLSTTMKLSNEYGTRHHAGLGLSEATDALVLVVSEERGAVTLFKEGAMIPIPNKSALTNNIVAHWQETSFPQLINHHGKSKGKFITQIAVSFILAFFFWSTVVLTQSKLEETSFLVPVEYVSVPKNLALVGDNPTDVRLTLVGPAVELHNINPAQIRVKIDLSTAISGKQTVFIQESNVLLPRHIRIKDSDPAAIDVDLIARTEVDAVVKPQLIGTIPEGYELIFIEVFPARIKVLAPVDVTNNKQITLLTTPIYLDNVRENKSIFSNIISPLHVQPIDNSWPVIQVNLKIQRHLRK